MEAAATQTWADAVYAIYAQVLCAQTFAAIAEDASMIRETRPAHFISLTAMFSVLSLIFLYLAAVLPVLSVTFYFISSLFVAGILVEKQIGAGLIMYVGVSLLSLLLVPNFLMVLPYVLLFGHYGIGKYLIEKIRDKIVAFILKLLYFNACMAGIYLLAKSVFFTGFIADLALPILIVLLQVVFVIFDFMYSKLMQIYFVTLRNKIVK